MYLILSDWHCAKFTHGMFHAVHEHMVHGKGTLWWEEVSAVGRRRMGTTA
jgi:hypothetical protein